MKRLTLLRHAKSDWDDPVARDFDRPLNRRGARAARTVGQEMLSLGLVFDLIFASPAVRVKETLRGVSEGYGRTLTPHFDEGMYLASPAALLERVRSADEGAESLLIVGHNPGLELLALLLTREDDGALRDELEIKYPTATLAEITLSAESWGDVSEGSGALTRFIRPRDLDPELGPDS